MLNQGIKLKPLNQRAKLPREYDYRLNNLNQQRMTIKIRSPIQEINTIGRFGDSINQLDKLRIEKEHLQNVVPVVRNLTVWERLSKAKHSLNSFGEVIGNPYRHEKCLRTGPAVRTIKQYQPAKRLLEKSVIKPSTQVANNFKESVKISTKKGVKINDDNKCLNKSVTDLMIKNSKSSGAEITPKNSNIIASTKQSIEWCEIDISDADSEDVYESAMQIKDSEESVTFSARIALDFRAALEKRSCSMDADEISVVKNIVKTDKRLQNVRCFKEDDFRNVLRSKLRKISKQETILKNALRNLGNDPQGIQQLQDLMSVNNTPQVHVILNNVPNMQREAVILRALGEKLEEVLSNCTQKLETDSKSNCNVHEETKPLYRVYHTLGPSYFALGKVRVQGVCVHIAFVREFCIAKKTINELKNEKRQFYLPANEQLTELRRTSFKRLREDPQLLLSYLQPKDSLVPFNVLEQDSFFFTSFLHKSFRSVSSSEDFSDDEETVVICEPNDSNNIHKKESLKIEEIDSTTHRKLKPMRNEAQKLNEINVGDTFTHMENSNPESKYKDQVKSDLPSQSQGDVFRTKPPTTNTQNIKSQVAPIRGIKRRRVRKHITPMPERIYVNPKNRIVTYVLVGVVEVSLLLALIMSFCYPDIACPNAENLGRRK